MLRALCIEDMEPIRKWRNACLDTLRTPFPLTKEQQEDWYRREICDRNSRSRFWAIEDGHGKLVGYGGIENIQWENSIGEISLLIDPEQHGKGYGRAAANDILMTAFQELNLHQVYAECYMNNPAAGFWDKMFDGGEKTVLRERKRCCGNYYNSWYYSLTEYEL